MEQLLLPRPMHLSRAYLNRAVGTSLTLGESWSRNNEDLGVLMVEEYDGGYHVTLKLHHPEKSHCAIEVIARPMVQGWACIALGEHLFRARFSQSGKALILAIPTALLVAAAGPDLQIFFELEGVSAD